PRYLIVAPITAGLSPHQRSDQMVGDASLNFQGSLGTNFIQGFPSDGFQVGSDPDVNGNTAACGGPPCNYAWVAFGSAAFSGPGWGAVSCPALGRSGGAVTLPVPAPNSFEMTFDSAVGGGIHTFYDLSEDPGRSYDLAGNAPAELKVLHHFGFLSAGTWYSPD